MGDACESVLVVEDEPWIALDLQYLLQTAGYAVVGPAASVAEALQLIDARRASAAIVDWNLGGESSEQVVHALRASSVPIMVLTGYSTRAALALPDACPIVQKPYLPEEVLKILRTIIERPSHIADDLSGMAAPEGLESGQ